MDEGKLVSEIMAKIRLAESDIQTKRNQWLEHYKMYRNYRSDAVIGGRSNRSIPLAFEWVEVVKSRLFDIFCGKRPYVRVKGREPMDEYPAKAIELYQNYQYDLENQYRRLVYNILTQALVYGTGIAKVCWRYKEDMRTVYQPILQDMPQLGSLPEQQMVPIYDNVFFELVDIFDFFVDPSPTIREAQWCAHRTYKSVDHVIEMANQGIYTNIDELVERTQGDRGGHYKDQNKQEILVIEGHQSDKGGLVKPIELIEYQTDDSIIVIADGKKVIRQSDNPYNCKTFIAGKIIETPHEFYGVPLIESGAQLAKVVEDLINNALDNQQMAINKMVGINELLVDDTEAVIRPAGIWHTRGNPHDAIFEFQFSDIAPSVFQLVAMINDFAKRSTGVVDYVVGQAAGGKTATEASLLTNEAAKRIGLHIHVFGDTFVGELSKMVHDMNRKFLTADKLFRVTAMDGMSFEMVKMSPDVLGVDVDFIWEHEDRELNNMVAVQQMNQLLMIANSNPILMGFVPILFAKVCEIYGMHQNDDLMKAANLARQLVPMAQLAAITGGGGMEQEGGMGSNAKKNAGGSEGNVRQSANKKSSPQYGSITQVRG